MPTAPPDPRSFLPLTPLAFQVLLALADSDRHGYGIILEVRERTDGLISLGTGTLYTMLQRLLEESLIAEADRPAGEARRRPAPQVLRAHAARTRRRRRRGAPAPGRRSTRPDARGSCRGRDGPERVMAAPWSWIDRSATALWRLAPRAMRQAWQGDAVLTMRAVCVDAYERGGWLALIRTASRELGGLAMAMIGARFGRRPAVTDGRTHAHSLQGIRP